MNSGSEGQIYVLGSFRNRAAIWYRNLNTAERTVDWTTLSTAIKSYYKLSPEDTQAKRFEIKVALHNLTQNQSEGIIEHLSRADEIALKLPKEDVDVGMATLWGVREGEEKGRVSYNCHKESDFTCEKAHPSGILWGGGGKSLCSLGHDFENFFTSFRHSAHGWLTPSSSHQL